MVDGPTAKNYDADYDDPSDGRLLYSLPPRSLPPASIEDIATIQCVVRS